MGARRTLAIAMAVATLGALADIGAPTPRLAVAHEASCAGVAPGGDWPLIGRDLEGSRSQPAEHRVLPPVLPRWTFDANRWTHGTNNEITGLPIVSDGCVYVGSSAGDDPTGQHLPGWVFAINADDGDLVWKRQVGGGVYSTLAVDGDVVYAFVSEIGRPHVTALDKRTGEVRWSTVVDRQLGSDAVSSPIPYAGMLWVGISGTAAEGDEADRNAFQGSSVLLATRTLEAPAFDPITEEPLGHTRTYQPGEKIRQVFSIPQDLWDEGYAGGAQWGTLSVDTTTATGFVGTGNPFNYDAEHPNTNAVLRLDLDVGSPTFATITGSYKGDVEEYFPGLGEHEACEEAEDLNGVFAAGVECLNLDLDFGATPNIYTDQLDRRVVSVGQKSGVVHTIDADTMEPVSKTLVGHPSAVGGVVGSAAFDGTRLFGPHTVGGYLWSIDATTGAHQWFAPVGDGVHWGPPVTHANGILWTPDLAGFLNAYDAQTGALLQHIPMVVGSETRTDPTFSWGGATVARNTVFVSVGVGLTSAGLPSAPNGFVIAYGNVGHVI